MRSRSLPPQETLTYRQLNQRANHLARILHQKGVQLGTLVGLCVERSADMLIGILAILKAGGAYVPLDPNYPSDRAQFMLADTQVSLVLTQSWLVGGWGDGEMGGWGEEGSWELGVGSWGG
ncbi:AMP-binding protein, partial [Geitlerinema splendidum]|nr:AMP-binding protein [Geitlerinema splendidum]